MEGKNQDTHTDTHITMKITKGEKKQTEMLQKMLKIKYQLNNSIWYSVTHFKQKVLSINKK